MEENSINKESNQTTISSKFTLSWFYKINCWYSGARLYLLEKCPVYYNKFFSVGAIVIITMFISSISEGCVRYVIFNNFVIAILVGIIGGVLIFSDDRYIVSRFINNNTLKLINYK